MAVEEPDPMEFRKDMPDPNGHPLGITKIQAALAGTLMAAAIASISDFRHSAWLVVLAAILPLVAIHRLRPQWGLLLALSMAIIPEACYLLIPGAGVQFTALTLAGAVIFVASIVVAFAVNPSTRVSLMRLPVGTGWLWAIGAAAVGVVVGRSAADLGGFPALPILPSLKLAAGPVLLVLVVVLAAEWLIRGPLLGILGAHAGRAGALFATALLTGALFAAQGPGIGAFQIGVFAGVGWGFANQQAESLLPSAAGAAVAAVIAIAPGS